MEEFRRITGMVDKLPPFLSGNDWLVRWEERNKALRGLLGETTPPQSCVPFSWKEHLLPGACAMTFPPASSRPDYLYITLGLTHPVRVMDKAYPWEFAVRARGLSNWPIDLLYQLLTQWHCEKGDITIGYRLPLVFFTDPAGSLWAGLTEDTAGLTLVGSIRALYLWPDETGLTFHVSSGEFGLLTAVAVTEDEDNLAQQSTPAHLLLFLRRLGLSRVCDPYRQSVLTKSSASGEWSRIKALPHDIVYDTLQQLPNAR